MKWMLIIVVFGIAPIKTDLRFDTLEECAKAAQQAEETAGRAFSDWLFQTSVAEGRNVTPSEEQSMMRRFGFAGRNEGTCIPHAP